MKKIEILHVKILPCIFNLFKIQLIDMHNYILWDLIQIYSLKII